MVGLVFLVEFNFFRRDKGISMNLEYTWRWYGPDDPVSLSDVKQAGATGVVTALHDIAPGNVWPTDEILKRKNLIKSYGLIWSVVESVAVHESIKTRSGDYELHLNNYKQTLQNLGACEIKTVCYNFMPILDWTRTHLNYPVFDGSQALCFDMTAFIAFDLFMLKRKGGMEDYTPAQLEDAEAYYGRLDESKKKDLQKAILMGLPGTVDDLSLEEFESTLASYEGIDESVLKANYYSFLKEIIPAAEEADVKMAVHPDDPPMSIFGLPRIVSSESDVEQLLNAVDSEFNGLTFCTGSFGAGPGNDVLGMVKKFAKRINFAHLRNVIRENDGSFYESDHLAGNVDMYQVMHALLEEQRERINQGRINSIIPMRPDHGHQMLDDLKKETYPGYSAIGRLRGLAELRGLEMGIIRSLFS